MHKAAHGPSAPQSRRSCSEPAAGPHVCAHGTVRSVPVPLERGVKLRSRPPRREARGTAHVALYLRISLPCRLRPRRVSGCVQLGGGGARLTHRHIICAAGHGIRSTSRFQVHTPPGATAWCSHTFITIRAVFYELKRRSRRSPGGGRNATRRTYNAYGSRFAVAVPRTICLRVIVRGQRASSTMTTQ